MLEKMGGTASGTEDGRDLMIGEAPRAVTRSWRSPTFEAVRVPKLLRHETLVLAAYAPSPEMAYRQVVQVVQAIPVVQVIPVVVRVQAPELPRCPT